MLLKRIKSAISPHAKRFLSDSAAYSGLYRIAANSYGGVGVIITLHRVVETGRPILYPGYMIHSDTLDYVIRTVRQLGWEIISIDEMRRRLVEQVAHKRFVCFTSDDGFLDNLQIALPVFRKHQAPFSVNICTGIIDRSIFYWWGGLEELVTTKDVIEFLMPGEPVHRVLRASTWEEKRRVYDTLDDMCHKSDGAFARALFQRYRIDAQVLLDRDAMTIEQARQLSNDPLVTIGAHCITHERLSHMSDADSYKEICEGKSKLEDWLGIEVRHLAYPFGNIDACSRREIAFAKKAGFKTAVTTLCGNIFPEHNNFMYSLPRRCVEGSLIGLRNSLFGVESILRQRPKFQTI